MVVKIYVWPSKRLGHISMDLSDKTYISWWPEQEVSTVDLLANERRLAKCFDTFEEEIEYFQAGPERTIYVLEGLDEKKIKEFFRQMLAGSFMWDIQEKSCSSVIYSALCTGSDWFIGRAGRRTTPNSVADLVQAFNDKKEKKIRYGCVCK